MNQANDSSEDNKKLESQLHVIKLLILKNDFDQQVFDIELEKLEKLSGENIDMYIFSIKKFIDEISRLRQNDVTRKSWIVPLVTKLISKQALSPYARGAQIEAIVNYLSFDIKSKKIDSKERKDISVNLLNIWKHIVDHIDENWDANVSENHLKPYFPPVSYQGGFYAGMSPQSITDEKVKREYSEFLKKRDALNRKSIEQQQAKQMKQRHEVVVKKYIIDLYSIPPLATEELATLLKKYNIDPKFSQEILDTIKKQIKSK
jgi:hypothetical protein